MRIFLIDFENTKSNGITGIDLLNEDDIVYLFYSNNVDSITVEAHMNIVASKAEFHPIKIEKPGKNALDFQLVTYLGYLIGTNHIGEYYIVSRDYGFQHSVNFCVRHLKDENVLVKRIESIEAALMPKKPAKEESKSILVEEKAWDILVQEEASSQLVQAAEANISEQETVKSVSVQNEILKEQSNETEVMDEEIRKVVASIYDTEQFEKFGERSIRLFQKAETKQGFYRSMTKAFGASIGRELYTLLKKEYDHHKN